jgi:Fic family protein
VIEPKFKITSKMMILAERVGSFNNACEVFVLEPSWEKKLREESWVKRLMYGVISKVNKEVIEKIINLSPGRDESVTKIIRDAGVKIEESSAQEIVNYRNTNIYVEQIVNLYSKSRDKINLEKELFNIHSLVSEKLISVHSLGVYRNVASESNVSIPAVELPYQMEDLFSYLNNANKEISYPLFKLGVLFYELLRLKPFAYGNRQTTYAYVRLMMFLLDYDRRRLLCLEESLERDREEFSELVEKCFYDNDITEFMELFLADVVESMDKVSDKLKRLSIGNLSKKRGRQISLSNRQISLIEELEIKGELTMNQARKTLPEVSDDTILRDLKDLLSKKIVIKKGKTKGSRYLLSK